jgi:ATP-dependent helicase HrpA
MDSTADDLRRRLPELMLRDEHRLGRRLAKARGADELARIAADVERSAQRVAGAAPPSRASPTPSSCR